MLLVLLTDDLHNDYFILANVNAMFSPLLNPVVNVVNISKILFILVFSLILLLYTVICYFISVLQYTCA